MTSRPLILLSDHVAPMRRAVRRLLGESRYAWQEVDGEELLRRSRQTPPTLMVLEDRTAHLVPALRAQGCAAPVVQLTNGGQRPTASAGVVLLDCLEAAARLPALVERHLSRA